MHNCGLTDRKTFMAAPLQGYTDAAWREAHSRIYGGVDVYFTPFVRVERGEVRRRDLRDAALPTGYNLVPQIIFRDMAEFDMLADALAAQGHRHINLNLGCPFPPQVHHGRGTGALVNRRLMEQVCDRIAALPDIVFSLKMRLGVECPDEWRAVADVIGGMRLTHVTVHPRTARQQYGGELHMEAFAEVVAALPHPIVFNGDIAGPADIERVAAMPGVAGVMAGRGLLARPSLAAEWRSGQEWSRDERIECLRQLHQAVYEARATRITGGDKQLLGAMQPFWHYLEPEIGHRAAKAIRKATSLAKYHAALSEFF